VCREQLQNNASKGNFFLKVDFGDLMNFDEGLAMTLRTYPSDYIPLVLQPFLNDSIV
jgi:MCM N-terminal domain